MKKRTVTLLLTVVFASSLLLAIDLRRSLDGLRKVSETVRPISEEEEYFIGRAVAARILAQFPLLKSGSLTDYVNLVGDSLVIHSQRPEIYNGYHFAVLDSDEINAFAAPGGIILLTRGLVQAAASEDQLAAVIAHEICHVVAKDPLKAIKSERMKSLGAFTARELSRSSPQVMQVFNDTVLDVSGTLLQKGYSRKQEKQADLDAVELLDQSGYSPTALLAMLQTLTGRELAKAKIYSAHPPATDRCQYVAKEVKGIPAAPGTAERTARFTAIRRANGI